MTPRTSRIAEAVSTLIIGMNFGAFTRFFKVFSEKTGVAGC